MEHIPKTNHNINRSIFAEHIIENNHTYNSIEDNLQILHNTQKRRSMNVLEAFEIYRHSKYNPGEILNGKLKFN